MALTNTSEDSVSSLNLRRGEHGTTMLEYALLASLISLVVLVSVGYAGEHARGTFTAAGESIGPANKSITSTTASGGGCISITPEGVFSGCEF